jgi:hypothetical protein
METAALGEGVVVRDRKWGGRCTGTVTEVTERGSVIVAWHGSFVSDEMQPEEVEVWVDAPADLAAWRGGIGMLDRREGSMSVEAVTV